MINERLMQKVGIATQLLAGCIIKFENNDKLPTISELSDELELSRGTVQGAFAILKDVGAIELQPRGHLGSYIKKIDYGKLLEISGIRGLVGVMPLPYSKRYEGFASGVCSALEQSGLAVNFAFMRGSSNRLGGLLENRYDFAVMSKLSAEYYLEKGHNLRVVKKFGNLSYVNDHVVLTREDFSGDFHCAKVGIDNSSVDQMFLTQRYFKDTNVDMIPLLYNQIVGHLVSKRIDAAIWNLDDVDLKANKLSAKVIDDIAIKYSATEAVIVCISGNELVHGLLSKFLDVPHILNIQRKVISGELLPKY